MKVFVREIEKAVLQYFILPIIYFLFSYQKVNKNLVIFADGKNKIIPYSMIAMHKEVVNRKYEVINFCYDFSELSLIEKFYRSILFMKYFAKCRYVFICDYFLPVSSCVKKSETIVIQLWHSSGLQKFFGWKAKDDLGKNILTNPVKNYDLVSVSSELVREKFIEAWKLGENEIKAFGSSRTDLLFDFEYIESCKNKFYKLYPEAINKKIVVWAPSFRGNPSEGTIINIDGILNIKNQLKDEYYFIIKIHPNLKKWKKFDNCILKTEELYAVLDILITDYSSIFYDTLLLDKKVIFYVPDYDEYRKDRGMYIDYYSEFKYSIVTNLNDLMKSIKNIQEPSVFEIEQYKNKFIKMNDGNVSKRILDYLNII